MTREGNIKDFQGNKIAPNTGTPQVTDVAKQQGLSQTLLNTPDKDALGYEAFSTVLDYPIGKVVYKDNKLWKFTTAHTAGAWNASEVEAYSVKDATDINDTVMTINNIGNNLAGCILNDLYRPFTRFGQIGLDESSAYSYEHGYYKRYGYGPYALSEVMFDDEE